MSASSKPALFLGSSSEGREVARNLQAELGDACEVVRWDQGVFGHPVTPLSPSLRSRLAWTSGWWSPHPTTRQ